MSQDKIINEFIEPYAMKYDFDGDESKLLENFCKKIKPNPGTIKFKLLKWSGFPENSDTAKIMAKRWSKTFLRNEKYANLTFIIYFNIPKKTIRFEIKKYKDESQNLDNINSFESFKHFYLNSFNPFDFNNESNEELNKKIFSFNCVNWLDFPSINDCKTISKNAAIELSNLDKFKNYKFIVFMNQQKKQFKITIKNKNITITTNTETNENTEINDSESYVVVNNE